MTSFQLFKMEPWIFKIWVNMVYYDVVIRSESDELDFMSYYGKPFSIKSVKSGPLSISSSIDGTFIDFS